jgi:hypothetical protein
MSPVKSASNIPAELFDDGVIRRRHPANVSGGTKEGEPQRLELVLEFEAFERQPEDPPRFAGGGAQDGDWVYARAFQPDLDLEVHVLDRGWRFQGTDPSRRGLGGTTEAAGKRTNASRR